MWVTSKIPSEMAKERSIIQFQRIRTTKMISAGTKVSSDSLKVIKL